MCDNDKCDKNVRAAADLMKKLVQVNAKECGVDIHRSLEMIVVQVLMSIRDDETNRRLDEIETLIRDTI